MKHVFVIHSNIAIVMANSIIERYRLDRNDVIFINARNVKSNLNVTQIESYNLLSEFEKLNMINFLFAKRRIDDVDELINSSISVNYKLYVPHLANPFFQILATHPKCHELSIVEEGANCLSKRLYLHQSGIKRWIIDFLLNRTGIYGNNRYYRSSSNIDDRFLKHKVDSMYAITPNAFSNVSKEIIIIPLSKRNLEAPLCKIEDNAVIIIFEAIVDQGNLFEETMIESVKKLIENIQEDRVNVKFHPAQCQTSRSKLLELLNAQKDVNVIDDQTILEIIFLKRQNLYIYGFTSSLLHYGKVFGHNVFSFAELWKGDPLFIRFRKLNDFELL